MNLDQIETKCFILALFIRDDGERFLLGSRAYEFVDSQLHFAANSYQNDVVEVQGNDGLMLAGQVRRATSQAFDGYIGDSSVDRSTIEQYRRDFMKFFRKNHYYKVVYVLPDGSAIQRRNGFIVEAPEVKELYQLFPKYHISMNFEDINYYNYEEDSEGEEIYGESAALKIATAATGGLIWSNSSSATITGEGTNFTLEDTVNGNAISDVQLKGDTTQQTYSGKNLLPIIPQTKTQNGVTITIDDNGVLTANGTSTGTVFILPQTQQQSAVFSAGTYTLSISPSLSTTNGALVVEGYRQSDLGTRVYNSDWQFTDQYTFTISEALCLRISVVLCNNGKTFTNKEFRVQLESGSSATSYEPYVGGIPAPNPDYPQTVNTATGRQVVDVYDKNLYSSDTNWVLGKLRVDGSGYDNQASSVSVGDGSVTIVQSASWQGASSGYIKVNPSTSYTLSFNAQNGSVYIRSWLVDSNKNFISYNSATGTLGNNSYTIDTTPNTEYIKFSLESGDGAGTYVYSNIQIELGSTATPYQTHQSYEVNLGKNLLDNTSPSITGSGVTWTPTTTGGTYTAPSTTWGDGVQWRPNLVVGQPYTFQVTIPSALVSDFWVTIHSYTDDTYSTVKTEFLAAEGPSITKTFTPDSPYIRIRIVNRDVVSNADITNLQLELGSATTYAPYFEPIELCKIGDYQDYIYQSGSDWYLHKAIGKVDFGTLTWTTTTSAIRGTVDIADIKYVSSNTEIGSGIAQKYIIRQGSGLASYQNYIAIDTAKVNVNTGSSSIDPTGLFYYALATATDTQITNADLVSQLNALAGATTYDGQTVFTVTSDNRLAILSLSTIGDGGGGVVWDQYGAEWEEGTGGGPTMISVDSIDNVYPVLTLTGPAVNPQISVITTNTTLSYTGTITSSQELKIDMFNKTATLNGVSVIGNVSGDWIYLKPGINRVTYATNNADTPDATIWWQEIVG